MIYNIEHTISILQIDMKLYYASVNSLNYQIKTNILQLINSERFANKERKVMII